MLVDDEGHKALNVSIDFDTGVDLEVESLVLPEVVAETACSPWVGNELAATLMIGGHQDCELSVNGDGSINGICYVGRSRFDDGVDLGAYLIERGWAMARPEAPFEYHALERIARHHGMGVWGLSVDRIPLNP